MTRTLTCKPVLALAELRLAVLAHNERRSPKWGFRLAPDLALQLQAKPVVWRDPQYYLKPPRQEVVRFEGQLEYRPNGVVPADVFRHPPTWHGPHMRRQFWLVAYADAPEVWELQDRGGGWSLALSPVSEEVTQHILTRVHTAFTDGTFERFHPELMLRPACLCCGRALTDPASMARWIGPECAGTSSLNVPRLFQVAEPAAPRETREVTS